MWIVYGNDVPRLPLRGQINDRRGGWTFLITCTSSIVKQSTARSLRVQLGLSDSNNLVIRREMIVTDFTGTLDQFANHRY